MTLAEFCDERFEPWAKRLSVDRHQRLGSISIALVCVRFEDVERMEGLSRLGVSSKVD